MPRNPAPHVTDPVKEEPRDPELPSWTGQRVETFDPSAVKVGNIKDPDKIAAKIESARLKHIEIRNAVKVCVEAGAKSKPPEQPPAPPVQVIERRIETVTVEIPLGETMRHFQQVHIGEALVYGEHAQTWARLRQGLRDKGTRTADGKEVRSGPDILRWLLEQFASPGGVEPEVSDGHLTGSPIDELTSG